MTFGPNTYSPLTIEDAREAAYRASELQRTVEDAMRTQSKALAEAERAYRQKLSERILTLRAEGNAITACETIAKGEREVADLRYQRDVQHGLWEAVKQEAFRRGADRADLGQLLRWSMARDLRTDVEPPSARVVTFGNRDHAA